MGRPFSYNPYKTSVLDAVALSYGLPFDISRLLLGDIAGECLQDGCSSLQHSVPPEQGVLPTSPGTERQEIRGGSFYETTQRSSSKPFISYREKFLQEIQRRLTSKEKGNMEIFLDFFEKVFAMGIKLDDGKTFRELLSDILKDFDKFHKNREAYLNFLQHVTQLANNLEGVTTKQKIETLKKLVVPYGKYKLGKELASENKQMGEAIDNGDCFFDSFAQGLQQLGMIRGSGEPYTAEALRLLCFEYANQSPSNDWLKEAVEKREEQTWQEYSKKIGSMATKTKSPIWGEIELEGRILIEHFNGRDIRLHIRQIDTDENLAYRVQDRVYFLENGNLTFELYSPEKHATKDSRLLVELAIYRRHVMPVFPAKKTSASVASDGKDLQDKERLVVRAGDTILSGSNEASIVSEKEHGSQLSVPMPESQQKRKRKPSPDDLIDSRSTNEQQNDSREQPPKKKQKQLATTAAFFGHPPLPASGIQGGDEDRMDDNHDDEEFDMECGDESKSTAGAKIVH